MKYVEIDGEELLVCESEVNGVGIAICVGAGEQDAEELLQDFVQRFPTKWPKFEKKMRSAFDDYGHSEDFPPEELFLSLSRMSRDVFMGKRSSILARFEFDVEEFSDSIPIYDFFVTARLRIMHHQAVF